MTRMNIKQLMDNYEHEKATPEEQAEARVFGDFLTRHSNLEATLQELKAKYKKQLNMAPEQVWWQRRRLGVAAAVAACVLGGYFYFNYSTQRPQKALATAPVHRGIHQGKMATLEVDNGKEIPLAGMPLGEVYSRNGIKIIKADSGRLVCTVAGGAKAKAVFKSRLKVPNGSEYSIIFSDGSKAQVGPGGEIGFYPDFNGRRKVDLEGLAEFDVVKNSAHPFEVVVRNNTIEVMGTQFNVSGYRNERVVTTLLSGSVMVTSRTAGKEQKEILRPGQRAIDDGAGLVVETVDSVYLSNLSKGYIVFKDTPLKEVLRQLARWYNVEVDNARVKDIPVTATVYFRDPLGNILEELNRLPDVKLQLKGDTITTLP